MLFLKMQVTRAQGRTVTGEVHYGEDHAVAIGTSATGKEFRDMVEGLIGRFTEKTSPRKVPSTAECRFCPIP